MVLCQRHRQSGILVEEDERLVGLVTRENLDQAIGHNLSHAPVKSVMSSDVVTCAESTPLPELTRLLRTSDAGRVAVLRDDKVVGVVTRSDLLRALGEPTAEEAAPAGPDLSAQLLAIPGLEPVFEAVQAVAEGFDGVYLVGGAVRDLLMDEPSFDVDIAVEGDGIAFGRALAQALGGRVVPHDKFGTAIVLYEGGRVDVATSRTEFYDYPGALPAVEQASIRQDLYRRDFTINAMAVSLKGEDFGRLVDFFGGLAGPRGEGHPRPPQPVVHRRPDAALPRDPLREPVRLPHGRAHLRPRARVHRDGARGRALLGAAARRAPGAPVGGRDRRFAAADGRAPARPGDPSPSGRG